VGGESPPALRRAAKLGDAWYPIGSNQKFLYDSLPRYQAALGRLRQLTIDAGRAPDAVAPVYRVKRYGTGLEPLASDGNHRLFSGTDADIVNDFKVLRDQGVRAIDIDFERPTADELIAEMGRFKAEVLAKI
jgi:alkanesulfonate monooxygenase SsuD/methylene tetrahydromethanopterin reductase-like flavin-dependent oxidoreductase (luciferase family)